MDPLIATLAAIVTIVGGVLGGVTGFFRLKDHWRRSQSSEEKTHSNPPMVENASPAESSHEGLASANPTMLQESRLLEKRQEAQEAKQLDQVSEIDLVMAENYRTQGQYLIAQIHYEQARTYFMATGDFEKLGLTLVGLASTFAATGKYGDCISMAKEAEKMLIDPYELAEVRLRRAISLSRLGKYDEAIEYLNQARDSLQQLNNRITLAETYIVFGGTYRKQNKLVEAEEQLKQSLAILESELSKSPNDQGANIHLTQAKASLSKIRNQQGKHAEALRLLVEAFETSEKISFFYGVADYSYWLALFQKEAKDWKEARHWYHESFIAASMINKAPLKVRTLLGMTELAYVTIDLNRAERLASLSRDEASGADNFDQLAQILALFGNILCTPPFNEGAKAVTCYMQGIEAALKAGASTEENFFATLKDKLTNLKRNGDTKSAQNIVSLLSESWKNGNIDGKRPDVFENEQFLARAEIQAKPKRVSQYLLDLVYAVNWNR